MKRNKLSEIIVFFQMLKKMFSDKKTSKWAKIITIITLVYILIPVDLIPDFVPIMGLLDDLSLLIGAFSSLLMTLKNRKKSKEGV